jgi:O-antigen/teichoic acid export membrane protein
VIFSSSNSRRGRVVKAVCSGAASRLLGAGVSFLTLPLTVRYLGAERYGVWATITTTVVWITLLDLGIANTLTNQVSRAYALDDKKSARRYFTTALTITVAVTALAVIAFGGVFHRIDCVKLFNVSPATSASEVKRTVMLAAALMLLALPCNLGSKILAGYQELHFYNYATTAGAFAGLVGLSLGITLHVSMPTLYLMSLGCLTYAAAAALLIALWRKPWLRPKLSAFDFPSARELLDSGSWFFLIQVAAVVVFSSDNLVVSHFLGASEVTPYSVTWRFAGLAAILQSLIFPALWPAYAEAYARRDYGWIRRTFAKTMRGIVGLYVVCALLLVSFGRFAIRIWAGQPAVPGSYLLVAMAVWIVINGFMTMESCLLAALNRTRGQALLSVVAAAVNIALSLFLVRHFGALGVIGGTVLSYLLVLVVPQSLIVRSVWRRELRQADEAVHDTRNGLLSRSSPIVVSGPCPGTTTVSSGSASTGPCNDRMIFS